MLESCPQGKPRMPPLDWNWALWLASCHCSKSWAVHLLRSKQYLRRPPRLAEILMAGLPLRATDLQTSSRSTASQSRAHHSRAETSARQALVCNATHHPFISLVPVLCFAATGSLPGYHGAHFGICVISCTVLTSSSLKQSLKRSFRILTLGWDA